MSARSCGPCGSPPARSSSSSPPRGSPSTGSGRSSTSSRPPAPHVTRPRRTSMQAKDLDPVALLRAIDTAQHGEGVFIHSNGTPGWAMWWDVLPLLPDVPPAVVYAKARRLRHQGLISACIHSGKIQCRGDLELTEAGRPMLAASEVHA